MLYIGLCTCTSKLNLAVYTEKSEFTLVDDIFFEHKFYDNGNVQYNHTYLKIFTFSGMLLPFHVICWLVFAQMHCATLSSEIYSDLYWSDMLHIWMQIWNAFKKTILEMVEIVTINIILDNPQVGQFSFEGPISSLP